MIESLKYLPYQYITMKTIEKGDADAQRKNDIVEKLARTILSDCISNAQRGIKNSIVEKLKIEQGTSKRKHLLAQSGSKEEAFWDGHADALGVAIAIVEYEGCED